MTVSYLKWSRGKRQFLGYYAMGLDLEEIAPRVHNQRTGRLGVAIDTIQGWIEDDADLREAVRQIEENPTWYHDNIALPTKLAALDMRDLEYILGENFRGFSAKDKELILTEMGKLNGIAQAGNKLNAILKGLEFMSQVGQQVVALPAPAPVIELAPSEVKVEVHGDNS
jgi:hypothetical protein